MYNVEGAEWILKHAGPLEGRSVCEFGNQRVWEHAMSRLGIRWPVARDWMLKQLKVAEYVSIDTNGQDYALPLDLTEYFDGDARRMYHQFDVVTNIGTTEHCGKEPRKQWVAFANAVNLCKPGGVILHQLPPVGQWLDHCDVWYREGLGNVLANTMHCVCEREERVNLPTLNPAVDYLCVKLRKCKLKDRMLFTSRQPPEEFEAVIAHA